MSLKVEVLKEGYAYETFPESHYTDHKKSKEALKSKAPAAPKKEFMPKINDGVPQPSVPKPRWVKPSEIDNLKAQLKKNEPQTIDLPYAPLSEEDSLTKIMSEDGMGFREIKEANTTEEYTKNINSEDLNELSAQDESPTYNEQDNMNSLIKIQSRDGDSDEKESPERGDEDFDDEDDDANEPAPLLYVDVNMGNNMMKRIVMYEGDDPEEKAIQFAEENRLDDSMLVKLKELLKKQINGVLVRIDEDDENYEDGLS